MADYHRFLLPTVPLIYILSTFSAVNLAPKFKINHKFLKPFLLVILLTFASQHHYNYFNFANYWTSYYSKGLNNAHIPLGKWIAKNTPTNTKIALNDAGAIPYYSERYTYDIAGLNSPDFLQTINFTKLKSSDLVILISSKEDSFTPRIPKEYDIYLHIKDDYHLISKWKFSDIYFLFVFQKS